MCSQSFIYRFITEQFTDFPTIFIYLHNCYRICKTTMQITSVNPLKFFFFKSYIFVTVNESTTDISLTELLEDESHQVETVVIFVIVVVLVITLIFVLAVFIDCRQQ